MRADPILPGWEDTDLYRALVESAPDATVLVDERGTVVLANRQAEVLFGYSREELLGAPIEVLVPERYRGEHPQHRTRYVESPRPRPMGSGIDLFALRKDGTEFAAEISLSPVEGSACTAIAVAIRDVTERKRADEKVRASLREKEVLLQEVHHRVKNSLQVTSSMLKLQSASIRDPGARELFVESQNRIRSMALVHEKLYRSSQLSRVNLGDYARDLAKLLFRSFGADPEHIALDVRTADVFLGIDAAIPCGLILHELLSNCLKHAFPGGRSGRIEVVVARDSSGHLLLGVRDDGVGLPASFSFENANTLGLQLVSTLVEQLQAQLEVKSVAGTEVRVRFPETPR